jgi:hypothetical protein
MKETIVKKERSLYDQTELYGFMLHRFLIFA